MPTMSACHVEWSGMIPGPMPSCPIFLKARSTSDLCAQSLFPCGLQCWKDYLWWMMKRWFSIQDPKILQSHQGSLNSLPSTMTHNGMPNKSWIQRARFTKRNSCLSASVHRCQGSLSQNRGFLTGLWRWLQLCTKQQRSCSLVNSEHTLPEWLCHGQPGRAPC